MLDLFKQKLRKKRKIERSPTEIAKQYLHQIKMKGGYFDFNFDVNLIGNEMSKLDIDYYLKDVYSIVHNLQFMHQEYMSWVKYIDLLFIIYNKIVVIKGEETGIEPIAPLKIFRRAEYSVFVFSKFVDAYIIPILDSICRIISDDGLTGVDFKEKIRELKRSDLIDKYTFFEFLLIEEIYRKCQKSIDIDSIYYTNLEYAYYENDRKERLLKMTIERFSKLQERMYYLYVRIIDILAHLQTPYLIKFSMLFRSGEISESKVLDFYKSF